jgi:RHS repeat-associated protein
VYDPAGRRATKVISSTQTNFLYDLANPVQELSGTTPTANLLTGGLDEYFTRTDSNGTANFLGDALGSTAALTDGTGTVQTQYTFDPFGNTTRSGNSSPNSFAYTGRENDGTGLYFNRARYYNPMIARFISEDPIGFNSGGTNLYSYGSDSPANLRDPSGEDSVSDNLAWSWDFAKSFVGDFSLSGRKQTELNQCAAQLANKASIASMAGLPEDSFWAQALAGNDVSTISNIITGQNRFWSMLSFTASNPTPVNLTTMVATNIIGRAAVGTERALTGVNGAGTTFVKDWVRDPFVRTGAGAFLKDLLTAAQAGKLLWDAGTYIGGLAVCAEQ